MFPRTRNIRRQPRLTRSQSHGLHPQGAVRGVQAGRDTTLSTEQARRPEPGDLASAAGSEHEPMDASRAPAPPRDRSGQPEMAFDPIAAALRELHEAALAETIPDDFLRLLRKLDEAGADKPAQQERT